MGEWKVGLTLSGPVGGGGGGSEARMTNLPAPIWNLLIFIFKTCSHQILAK